MWMTFQLIISGINGLPYISQAKSWKTANSSFLFPFSMLHLLLYPVTHTAASLFRILLATAANWAQEWLWEVKWRCMHHISSFTAEGTFMSLSSAEHANKRVICELRRWSHEVWHISDLMWRCQVPAYMSRCQVPAYTVTETPAALLGY